LVKKYKPFFKCFSRILFDFWDILTTKQKKEQYYEAEKEKAKRKNILF